MLKETPSWKQEIFPAHKIIATRAHGSAMQFFFKFQLNPESQLLTSQGIQNSEEITLQNSTAFHAISLFHIKAMRAQG